MAIHLLYPFIAAACYGLGYVLIERAVGHVSAITYFIASSLCGILIAAVLWFLKPETVGITALMNKPVELSLFLLAVLAPSIGWLVTTYAIRDVSAVYTAFGEASYPLFAIVFAFIFLGIRQWEPLTLIGGAMIIAGAMLMVYSHQHAKP